MLEQWDLLKSEINECSGLRSLKYHELWARMLTQFTGDFPLVLKLVVIALLIPVDTSECERVFSLMNDLKTSERNSLGQENLKNTVASRCLSRPSSRSSSSSVAPRGAIPTKAQHLRRMTSV